MSKKKKKTISNKQAAALRAAMEIIPNLSGQAADTLDMMQPPPAIEELQYKKATKEGENPVKKNIERAASSLSNANKIDKEKFDSKKKKSKDAINKLEKSTLKKKVDQVKSNSRKKIDKDKRSSSTKEKVRSKKKELSLKKKADTSKELNKSKLKRKMDKAKTSPSKKNKEFKKSNNERLKTNTKPEISSPTKKDIPKKVETKPKKMEIKKKSK